MAAKRSISPGPKDRMKEILKLIAEPNFLNNKKKLEVTHYQNPDKEVNHDYCDACSGGGEIICCDKCPRSYHIACHYPRINRLPIGDWFCRLCAYIDNDEYKVRAPLSCNFDINSILKGMFDLENSCGIPLEHMNEVPIQRKYNVKLPFRKSFNRIKMVRKTDRCWVCKRGYLKAQLVHCNFCSRLYHLNCMDPPIRDWDHSTRWICPAHNKFYELVYPNYFPSGSTTISDAVALKRLRCEVPPIQPVNSYFKIPSYIDAMYKKSKRNIPTTSTTNTSLNILCDIASFELESINNSSLKLNYENTSKDITEKFLASQHFNRLPNINLLPKQPSASLTCLTLPINISIKNYPFTIGKNINNHLCLQQYENCPFIADYHATITYDEVVGDYLMKNHSRHGIIVDNVAYYGNQRPNELINCIEQKKIFTQITKFLNKRRIAVRKNSMFCVHPNLGFDKVMKYVTKIRNFDYKSMSKYYNDNDTFILNAYRIDKCKCLKRLIPEDGFTGQALLHDNSIISIGCLQFKFTYNTNEVSDMYSEMTTIEPDDVDSQLLNDQFLRTQTQHHNFTDILRGNKTQIPLVTIDDNESNAFNEQSNISKFHINNPENGLSVDSIQSTNTDDLFYNNDNANTQFVFNNLSNKCVTSCTKPWNSINDGSRVTQSSVTNNLNQEVEINGKEAGRESVVEKFAYGINDTQAGNNIEQSITDIQDWIIKRNSVLENRIHYNTNEAGPSSANLSIPMAVDFPVCDGRIEPYKTEHIYCATTQTFNEIIVISDDEDDYGHVKNHKAEE